MHRIDHRRVGLLFITLVMAIVGLANAQERPFRESVSITVDADAAKTLRMIRDQWDNGPDAMTLSALVELCETRGDALVLQDRGVAGGMARFVRLQSAGDELIAGLSPDSLAAYRKRIDSLAEPWWKAWQTTGEARYLDRLVTRAFFSSWGDDAVWAAAQECWNRGDYVAATRLWQRLLPVGETPPSEPHYPDSSFSPPEITARLILCDMFSGQHDAARLNIARLAEKYPDALGSLGNRTGRWTDLLTAALEQSANWAPQVTSEDVTTYGGNPSRQRIAPKSLDIGGELWSVPISNPRLPPTNRPLVFPSPLPLAFHPAVLDDLVLLNDGRQLHAWNLYSGKPYWDAGREGGDVIYPLVADPLPMIPGRPVTGQAQWTVTAAHGRVYARMGSAVTTPAATEFRDLPAEMVCLDISQGEGQLLWKQSAEELVPAEGNLPAWRWEGSPVVESGRVYAVLVRRRPQLEWSVVCLDAESGLLLWHRSIGITRPTPPDHENRASSLLLTAAGGQLFLATGWGTMVAVDPRDGRVNWAVTYESTSTMNSFTGAVPPVYADGRLYAALLDSNRLACVDAATGRFLWSRPLMEPVRDIIGVVQQRVIVSGRSLWGFDANTGDLAWSVPSADPDDWGYGRGTLAGDQVLWTTSEVLWFVDQRSGALLRQHSLQGTETPRSGGNLVISHGVILIAGADRLTAYGEFARLQESLQRPVADRRRDVRRELKLAEIAWAAGDSKQAETLWDQVVEQTPTANQAEARYAQSRLSLLPGRRPPRTTVRAPSTVAVTPVAAISRSPSPRPASAATGYWHRVRQKPLSGDVRAILPDIEPGDIPAAVMVDGQVLLQWDSVSDEETVLTSSPTKLEWYGQWPERYVCVTDAEILVWDRSHQSMLQRLPRPTETLSKSTRWIVHPAGLLVLSPPGHLAMMNVQSGEWCWTRTSEPVGWQLEIGWNANRLAVHPRGQAGAEIWDVLTGRTLRREHPTTGPWKSAPQFMGSDDDYVTLKEDDRLVGVSTVPARRWEYVGVMSNAHVPPWVFTLNDHCFAVIDGQRVVNIQQESGWPRWSTVMADVPLRCPAEQVAVWNRTLFAANAGTLRAVNLETGTPQWKTPLSSDVESEWRCRILEADTATPVIAVIPTIASSSAESSVVVEGVEFFSATTGARCQRLRLQRPSGGIDIASTGPGRAVMLTDHEIIALQRP